MTIALSHHLWCVLCVFADQLHTALAHAFVEDEGRN